jgi:hypothetical protein
MRTSGNATGVGTWMSAIIRGGGLFAGVGGVVGATVATFDWPIVGTFFGAVEGAMAGAVVGVPDAVVLIFLARSTRSKWAAGITSGVVAAAGLGWASTRAEPVDVPRPILALLMSIVVLLGAALGPLIAYGTAPAPDGRPTGPGLADTVGRFLSWGAALGGAIGAVTGLVLGIRSYPPTSPVAAVEGAAFGAVNGLVLGCLAAAVSLLPRVRAGR